MNLCGASRPSDLYAVVDKGILSTQFWPNTYYYDVGAVVQVNLVAFDLRLGVSR